MDKQDIRSDLTELSKLEPPVRRAAYSDRTAWLMAIMAELAYTRFDQEDDSSLEELANELAAISDTEEITRNLQEFRQNILSGQGHATCTLRDLLRVGGFKLRGVLYDSGTDTQGFVASRSAEPGRGLAIVSFRGTESKRDWMTNLDLRQASVTSRNHDSPRIVGNVHSGFNAAYLSVQDQIHSALAGCEHLPLYVTGHSLGGALATLATWYLAGDKLAACYTFGAPRVGDGQLLNRFRTPIYRIVNGADPVPFVPPCEASISIPKVIVRVVGTFIPFVAKLDKFLGRKQGFLHYGYQRYLSICEPGEDGSFPKLRNEFGISSLQRLTRYAGRLIRGEWAKTKRLDKYHDIALYRAKLRAFAIRRQQPVI